MFTICPASYLPSLQSVSLSFSANIYCHYTTLTHFDYLGPGPPTSRLQCLVSSCSCCNMNIKCHSLINNLAQSLPERRGGFATETSEVISRTTISIFGNQNKFILVKSFLLHRTMSMTNSNVKVPQGPGFIFSY